MNSAAPADLYRPAWNRTLSLYLVVAAMLITGCAGTTPDPAYAPLTINFDSCEVGKLPPDFSTALTGGGGPIAWVVKPDPGSTSGKKILIQESADDTSYRFPLCIYEKAQARNVAVEVKYKALAGKVDQAGGIVLRYSPENYYIARANALENNIDLFKTVNGQRLKIQETPAQVSAQVWHTLRFEAKGSHLTVSFDGKVAIEADDDTFSDSGKVGLWTKADSVSAFTDLRIEPLP